MSHRQLTSRYPAVLAVVAALSAGSAVPAAGQAVASSGQTTGASSGPSTAQMPAKALVRSTATGQTKRAKRQSAQARRRHVCKRAARHKHKRGKHERKRCVVARPKPKKPATVVSPAAPVPVSLTAPPAPASLLIFPSSAPTPPSGDGSGGEEGTGGKEAGGEGSEEGNSGEGGVPAQKPVNLMRPRISGEIVEGSTLTASTGIWEGEPTGYSYQWEHCNSFESSCIDIPGEESPDYTLEEDDVGYRVAVVVEATNTAGTAAARSSSSARVSPEEPSEPPAEPPSEPPAEPPVEPPAEPPVNLSPPSIKGVVQVGSTLEAAIGRWEGEPTSYGYRWQRCEATGGGCSDIGGAVSATYTIGVADADHVLRVAVTATNATGSASATSPPTAAVSAESQPTADCTSTIGSGLQAAIQSAAAGSTICLQAGDYGSVSVTVTKSAPVTVRPAEGVARSQVVLDYVNVNTSSNLTFEGTTIDGANNGSSNAPATHIHWLRDTFTDGVCIQTPTSANIDVLVDRSSFVDISNGACNNEGRLEINGGNHELSGVDGVVVSNDRFEGGSPSSCTDGVNITGGASGAQIGPGDEFVAMKQGSCSAHVDPIQFYGAKSTTVTGDYFHDNSDGIMSPDGNGSPMTVTNCVFDTDGEYPDQIVIGGGEHDVISHDTFGHGARLRIGHVNVGATASNETVTGDVLTGGLELTEGQSPSGWTMEYNLVEGEVLGAHSVDGRPTYVGGGSEPSTWAGWQLASGSLGYQAAGDGASMGSAVFSSES